MISPTFTKIENPNIFHLEPGNYVDHFSPLVALVDESPKII